MQKLKLGVEIILKRVICYESIVDAIFNFYRMKHHLHLEMAIAKFQWVYFGKMYECLILAFSLEEGEEVAKWNVYLRINTKGARTKYLVGRNTLSLKHGLPAYSCLTDYAAKPLRKSRLNRKISERSAIMSCWEQENE